MLREVQAWIRGARAIEINLEPTPLSGAMDATLEGKAGEILPQLIHP